MSYKDVKMFLLVITCMKLLTQTVVHYPYIVYMGRLYPYMYTWVYIYMYIFAINM